jgi:excisionase family DNA binding protein
MSHKSLLTFLTVAEVAQRYRRTLRQVRAAIDRGTLPANRPPGAKEYRIAEADAEQLFGVVTIRTSGIRAERETENQRAERQLRAAGIAV